MRRILTRVLVAVPAVALQLAWLLLLASWLAPWAALIGLALSVLALLFVLYLITKQEEPTYKILWLLVILSFPLPGAFLYLMFGDKRTTRPLKKRLAAVQVDNPPAPQAVPPGAGSRLAQTFRYLEDITGAALHPNQQATFYHLGDEVYPVMLRALEQAKRYIFIEYFIIDKGVLWDSFVEILRHKAVQGVDVRVLYDDLGSISTYNSGDTWALQKQGIHFAAFNPLLFVRGTLNCRDHRKMMIIDGEVAFTGGINLADEYINQTVKFGHWKDFGLELHGPAVENYTRMFIEFWNAFSHESLPAPESVQYEPVARPDGYVLSYYDSPLRRTAASNELYLELLSQAQEYAYFYTPYLMLGNALQEAFVRAARRGVDVRIIMPGIPDKKLVFRMSRSFYPTLLQAGAKIYEYIPGFVHAKGCVVDGVVGTVGTVNLDYRSLFLHFENNALF